MEIRRSGKLHLIDNDGYIENSSVFPIQQPEFGNVVNKIIEELILHFKEIIHSIYIRGSVAKGIAIPNVSDIDMIILSNKALNESEGLLRNTIAEKVCDKHEFVAGVELVFMNREDMSNKTQFLLKTQCACIYGNDVIQGIQKFKLGKDAISHSENFYKEMITTIGELSVEEDENEIKEICSWVMKRIIRTDFETVMIRDNSYTRDLYPNYEIFSKYHPGKENEMKKALELAINPTSDKEEILAIINNLMNYIQIEIEKMETT